MSCYRCNARFGDMLHSTHGIDGTRNIVVYAFANTNRLVFENGVNCYADTGHEDGYFMIFRRVHACRRWQWRVLMQMLYWNGQLRWTPVAGIMSTR